MWCLDVHSAGCQAIAHQVTVGGLVTAVCWLGFPDAYKNLVRPPLDEDASLFCSVTTVAISGLVY